MYSENINNTAFYGKTRFLSCNSEGKSRRVSDYPFGTAYFGETRGLTDFIHKHSYPSADVEETIGKLHDNKTYKIYVADPKEVVTDLIKKNHDYVVYDIEPSFPDIKKYFETNQEDIKQGFKFLSEYYKRLENTGNKFDDIDKLKQNAADVCAKIFDEGADLRTRRKDLEARLQARYRRIQEIEENVPIYQKELDKKRMALANHKKNLEKKEARQSILKQRQISLINKINNIHSEVDKINSKINEYEEIILKLRNKIEAYAKRIAFLEKYIENAPAKISENKREIKNIKQAMSEIKNALIPNLKKLQAFYTINGIKIVKRI